MEYETHENIDDEVDEYYLYKLDKLSLDENKLYDPAFEIELKIIYDMKRLNGMNHIHDNEVNKIAEWNLLQDIINTSRRTKNINRHYYPILHGCINTQKGKARFKIFLNPVGQWMNF